MEKYKSEGEDLIAEFLEEKNLKFKREVELKNLKGDKFSSRFADFYLPRYKVFIEFFGRWNTSEKEKERYREKKRLYIENNIPCIYLYPENLGILNFLFERRLKKILKKGTKELYLFYYDQFTEKYVINLILTIVLFLAVKGFWGITGGILLLLYSLYDFYKNTVSK